MTCWLRRQDSNLGIAESNRCLITWLCPSDRHRRPPWRIRDGGHGQAPSHARRSERCRKGSVKIRSRPFAAPIRAGLVRRPPPCVVPSLRARRHQHRHRVHPQSARAADRRDRRRGFRRDDISPIDDSPREEAPQCVSIFDLLRPQFAHRRNQHVSPTSNGSSAQYGKCRGVETMIGGTITTCRKALCWNQ
jgi:hypothetical protein